MPTLGFSPFHLAPQLCNGVHFHGTGCYIQSIHPCICAGEQNYQKISYCTDLLHCICSAVPSHVHALSQQCSMGNLCHVLQGPSCFPWSREKTWQMGSYLIVSVL